MVFKHKDPCATLTQAEYIAACGDGHIFACQATGDILYASSATVLSKLAKGNQHEILSMGGSNIPAWTASPSVTDLTISGGCITLTGAATDIDLIDNNASALSFDASGQAGILEIVTTDCSEAVKLAGILDVNSSIDFDGTTVAACASGAITLTSTSSSACGIYLRANGGTSETVKIHSDQGTSVTEGAASVSLLSDAGGVELRSTADLANAINITNDGGTSGTITLFNDQGTSVTEGAASIALVSDAGGVELRSTANLANAINITNDGGTSGTITLFNDQGTSVTEGAASIELLSDAGGVELRSTANLANAINLTSDGGTAGTITLFNDQGTAVNEGVASIQVLSDVGGIGIKSGLNAAGAIRLTADAGTSETIVLHADQGSGTGSICLTSDAGGITLNPGTFVSVGGIADAEIRLFEDTGAGCNYAAIKVQNMSASYTLTLPADDGCCGEALTTNGSGLLTWAAVGGGIASLAADTTPQVGGSAGLDLQAQLLVGNGGTTGIAVSANGEVTMAAQPAFLAKLDAEQTNATGNGDAATVQFGTEVYCVGGDFNNTNDTFTAPVTGKYDFSTAVELGGLTTGMNHVDIRIVTDNNSFSFESNPEFGGNVVFNAAIIGVDMCAGHTATVTVRATGGAKAADIICGISTRFSGRLAH